MNKDKLRAGDTVNHRITGPGVLLVDEHADGAIVLGGYPDETFSVFDCELVEAASDADRSQMLLSVLTMSANNQRLKMLAKKQLDSTKPVDGDFNGETDSDPAE